MANLTELMRDIRHWSLKDQVANRLLTSVVPEIGTLRSCGSRERVTAPGDPVALSNERPYRERFTPM
jgi:hypothetical protein